ncbi:MAG: tRNA (guanosine(46)-N7)-methyltransferase TrmB [Phycisphaerae bacterium]|nr:tRNA (guanosine(46)-N7)-methyltransferase TrmB [Phycisphaerae bacterium]
MHRTLHSPEVAVELTSGSIVMPLDFAELFNRDAPVEIDVGCGDGTFLVEMAAQNPARNFLGIERHAGRVDRVCHKVTRFGLGNVRILRLDLAYAISCLLPSESIAALHLLFPDPWPKRRHHRRRSVTSGFVKAVHRALAPGGLFHVTTDHAEYFRQIQRLTATQFTISGEPSEFPKTKFEQHFATTGTPIYRLLLRKISPLR